MIDLRTDPLDRIPSPHEVRCRLSRTLRDASFLRRLLKLTEQWQRELDFRRETIQRLIAESNGKLMRGTDPRLTETEGRHDG